jgi:hypothetical protein
MGFAEGINDFMGSIFGREGLLGKSGISEFLGDKVAKPVLKAGYGDIIGKGSSDWKGSDILRALAGFVGMGAGAEYLAPSGGSPPLDPIGAGGDPAWSEPKSGGMDISQLASLLKGMGGQKGSGGGEQSLDPLYRLLESTKRNSQQSQQAPTIQPLPPMQSILR